MQLNHLIYEKYIMNPVAVSSVVPLKIFLRWFYKRNALIINNSIFILKIKNYNFVYKWLSQWSVLYGSRKDNIFCLKIPSENNTIEDLNF